MTTIRRKIKCESVLHTVNGAHAKLSPVTSGSPENDEFFKWTPHGEFSFGTINPNFAGKLVPGEEYFIDITPAKG